MSRRETDPETERGFALVLTLALLALLVLLVLALATVSKVDAQIATISVYQAQARQNALLGMRLALGELQKHAGVDQRVTAMAGIAGVPAGTAGGQRRQWCGVWDDSGTLLAWLVSGAERSNVPSLRAGLAPVLLVADLTVGAEATNSEHVVAGRISVDVIDHRSGAVEGQGGYAYWVGDEGVKISAYSPVTELALPGVTPLLASTPAVMLTLRNSLVTWAARLPEVLSFEQLRLLPAPGSPLPNSTIRDNFHQVTLAHFRLMSAGPGVIRRSGTVNINTTSQPVWNSLATTYNTITQATLISNTSTMGNRMRDNLPLTAAPGKVVNGPFLSVDALLTSGLLTVALNGLGATPAEFMTALGPLLTTRSDTFRIRAYGDAVNPADATAIEAIAYCEAIVQRTAGESDPRFGRPFSITYFRWLGPDDI